MYEKRNAIILTRNKQPVTWLIRILLIKDAINFEILNQQIFFQTKLIKTGKMTPISSMHINRRKSSMIIRNFSPFFVTWNTFLLLQNQYLSLYLSFLWSFVFGICTLTPKPISKICDITNGLQTLIKNNLLLRNCKRYGKKRNIVCMKC